MMNNSEYKTSLAKIQAHWSPDVRLDEMRDVHQLTAQKIRALDLSMEGLKTMILEIGRLQTNEDDISRRRVLRQAKSGLLQLMQSQMTLSDWTPIWDVFAYWPAAAEIAKKRPLSRSYSMAEKIENLRRAVS